MWDVIIVGAGPSGAVAAKRCAQKKIRTLLLERKRLPRDKVCTGMIMSPMSKGIIRDEFGEIPSKVLTEPRFLSGIELHLGTERHLIQIEMPLTWRRDLDYWLVGRAKEDGAEVWEEIKITHIEETADGFRINLFYRNKEIEVRSRFLIGADGGHSMVRKFLFPKLQVRYGLGYRECYKIDLGLDRSHWHLFISPEIAPYYFSIVHKEEFLLIDYSSRLKEIRGLVEQAHKSLAREYGFNPNLNPIWYDACIEPVLYHELFSGSFLPASNNCLLVGDAAGLLLPISGEGIGAALKSGLMASESVIEAMEKNDKAGDLYLDRLIGLISGLKELYEYARKIRGEKDEEKRILVMKEAWRKALDLK